MIFTLSEAIIQLSTPAHKKSYIPILRIHYPHFDDRYILNLGIVYPQNGGSNNRKQYTIIEHDFNINSNTDLHLYKRSSIIRLSLCNTVL